MHVRPYEEADEPVVTALWREALPITAPHHDPATSIRNKLAVDRDLFFVAVVGGAVVGTVMGGYDGHRGWVYSLAVRADRRRAGVGTALIRRVEQALAERGCLKVNLQVRVTNPGAVAFYEKLGYSAEELVSMGRRLY
jgi:ribosomal protein S18 acetylase RimI-like enzyme